jgi:glycosyltransferase involved in cell wall biosynthesis
MPAISVVMPVHNAGKFLRETIHSILQQTFSDFEFLIYNDGSQDNSAEIIKSFTDPRITFIDSAVNKGYVPRLNEGIRDARGKYIARMDADDTAHPERFRKQFEFLEANADYIVCGTRFIATGEKNVTLLPLNNDEIKLKMLYITPFCHPSVMIRTKVFKENDITYDSSYMPAEDYALWVRLSGLGKFCNLSEALMFYRIHDNNISLKRRSPQQENNLANAQKKYIKIFFSDCDVDDTGIQILHNLFYKEIFNGKELEETGVFVDKLIALKCDFPVARQVVIDLLRERFFYRCTTSTYLGLQSFLLANRFKFMKISIIGNTKLFVKSILKYGT